LSSAKTPTVMAWLSQIYSSYYKKEQFVKGMHNKNIEINSSKYLFKE
jgi:hypothetical protein